MRGLLALLGLLLTATAADAFELNARAQAALAKREAYTEVSPDPDGISGHVRAVIDIAAPPAKVWAMITDCAWLTRC